LPRPARRRLEGTRAGPAGRPGPPGSRVSNRLLNILVPAGLGQLGAPGGGTKLCKPDAPPGRAPGSAPPPAGAAVTGWGLTRRPTATPSPSTRPLCRPRVVGLRPRRLGRLDGAQGLLLSRSGAPDPASAQDLRNFVLRVPAGGRGQRL